MWLTLSDVWIRWDFEVFEIVQIPWINLISLEWSYRLALCPRFHAIEIRHRTARGESRNAQILNGRTGAHQRWRAIERIRLWNLPLAVGHWPVVASDIGRRTQSIGPRHSGAKLRVPADQLACSARGPEHHNVVPKWLCADRMDATLPATIGCNHFGGAGRPNATRCQLRKGDWQMGATHAERIGSTASRINTTTDEHAAMAECTAMGYKASSRSVSQSDVYAQEPISYCEFNKDARCFPFCERGRNFSNFEYIFDMDRMNFIAKCCWAIQIVIVTSRGSLGGWRVTPLVWCWAEVGSLSFCLVWISMRRKN